MWIIILLFFGLAFKGLAMLFGLGSNLKSNGTLLPVLMVIGSIGSGYYLWGESVGSKVLAVVVGAVLLFISVAITMKKSQEEQDDNPIKSKPKTDFQIKRVLPGFTFIAGGAVIYLLWGEEEKTLAIIVSVVTFILVIAFAKYQYDRKNNNKTNSKNPVKNSGLQGVVFGSQGRKWICKPEDTDGHVLVVGGVGSGKTSCIGIPTLRAWGSSVFAIDIKGELYEKTKDHRPNIKVFNPLDHGNNAYGYDPLYCLRKSSNPAQEARAIAQAIIPLPPDTKEPFWIENAQNILTACILHFNEQDMPFLDILGEIQFIAPKELIQILCESPVREAVLFVKTFSSIEDKVLFSIMAELSKNTVPFLTDKDLVLSFGVINNITPEDLEYGNDIYIQIPEHLLRQWKNLLTLIVNQFLTHFEKRPENNAQPILFLLDEFPRLGKINAMLDGLATLRSKKISMCLIIQSLAQLDVVYGKNERRVIADTCGYKAILGATDADTQDYFSRLVGTYDKKVTNLGTQSNIFGLPKGKSTNTSETEKRIIKPEEFGMLDDIVLLTPHGTIRVNKTPYYLDE
jgi:type IV secretion system protein VirD4